MGFPGGSDSKESACNVGEPALIPGLGSFPGEYMHSPCCGLNVCVPLRFVCWNPDPHRWWYWQVEPLASGLSQEGGALQKCLWKWLQRDPFLLLPYQNITKSLQAERGLSFNAASTLISDVQALDCEKWVSIVSITPGCSGGSDNKKSACSAGDGL